MRLRLLPLALALVAFAAPVAHAGTVAMDGTNAVYTADPGEVNDIDAQLGADGSVQITDRNGNPVRVSGIPGCQASASSIDCPLDATGLTVDAGDGDDKVSAGAGNALPLTVLGGEGDDELTATGDALRLDGGAGDDLLDATGARPLLVGGPGADLLADHGPAVADCTGGGDDRALLPAKLILRGCPAPAACKVTVAKGQTIHSLVEFGLAFSATCPRPAAIAWTLLPDPPTRRLLHGARAIGTGAAPVDPGGYPLPAAAGRQALRARALGAAVRKALLRAPRAGITLVVSGTDGLALLRPRRLRVTLR